MQKTYQVKSVIVSRKPGEQKDEGLWTAFIGLFGENNPHLGGKAPVEVLDIPAIQKVRINELRNVSFYLEGNDIVINNLVSINLEKDGNILTLTGEQDI